MGQQSATPVDVSGGGSAASAMSAIGYEPSTPTGPTPTAGGTPPAGGEVSGMIGGAGMLNKMAMLMGKTPEERVKNANTFAAMVKDVGGTIEKMKESTLMQRMMEASMSGPSFMNPGASPAGGVAAIPKTFDPSMASHIVNQMGYK